MRIKLHPGRKSQLATQVMVRQSWFAMSTSRYKAAEVNKHRASKPIQHLLEQGCYVLVRVANV